MSKLTKHNRTFWPKMMQDFFGTEHPFDRDHAFWFPEKSVEVPSTNVIENEKEFKLELSAPGFDKKDFHVDIHDGVLSITAENKKESIEKKDNYRKKEFSYSSIRRSFALPENVQEEGIDAKYENGILHLVLPKNLVTANKAKKEITVA
jgi:HSP20 family protein